MKIKRIDKTYFLFLCERQVEVGEGPLAPAVLRGGVRLAPELPLGGQQPLHPHWPAGVNTTRGDPNLQRVT